MKTSQLYRATAALTAVFALAACEQTTTEPTSSFAPAAAITLPTATLDDAGRLFVCKDSPDPTATFDFTYTVGATQGTGVQNQIGSPFSVDAGDCVEVLNVDNTSTTTNSAAFTVTELDPDNLFLGADLYKFNPALDTDWTLQSADLANGVSSFVGNDRGVLIVFRNKEEPPPGDEGCTPGYWKNHLSSWAPTGFTPGQTAGSVFALGGFPSLASKTLLQTLDGGGGSGVSGAVTILLRAAVAALLNAAHPDVAYPRTVADIIADVNAAIASGDRDTILELAEELDEDNNLGCPLN